MHVGQKVECIKAHDARLYSGKCRLPEVGKFYHIRDIGPDDDGLWLVEIVNPENWCHNSATHEQRWIEPSFFVAYFRPVTDISALQALTKVKELEEV